MIWPSLSTITCTYTFTFTFTSYIFWAYPHILPLHLIHIYIIWISHLLLSWLTFVAPIGSPIGSPNYGYICDYITGWQRIASEKHSIVALITICGYFYSSLVVKKNKKFYIFHYYIIQNSCLKNYNLQLGICV